MVDFFKKHTNKPRIPYDDAIEEALCFGWIDSIVQRIDDEKFAQKLHLVRVKACGLKQIKKELGK